MSISPLRTALAACAFAVLGAPGARANDRPPSTTTQSGSQDRWQQDQAQDQTQSQATDNDDDDYDADESGRADSDAADAYAPQRRPQWQADDTSRAEQGRAERGRTGAGRTMSSTTLRIPDVMRITQRAMAHITAAEKAIDADNIQAARTALSSSERDLARLYNSPQLGPVLSAFDDAIDQTKNTQSGADGLDFAPLRAAISSYRMYLDPRVVAGVERARARAGSGDIQGAREDLRAARQRVAFDVALVPVEAAYTRVLAAQRALGNGDTEAASRILHGVPVIVSRIELSQPTLPIRFMLQAAALSAAHDDWDNAKSLLSSASKGLDQLQNMASDKQTQRAIRSIADDVDRLRRQASSDDHPSASEIRDVTQDIRRLGGERASGDRSDRAMNAARDSGSDMDEGT